MSLNSIASMKVIRTRSSAAGEASAIGTGSSTGCEGGTSGSSSESGERLTRITSGCGFGSGGVGTTAGYSVFWASWLKQDATMSILLFSLGGLLRLDVVLKDGGPSFGEAESVLMPPFWSM